MILDFIFPKRCVVCDAVLPLGKEDLCQSCQKNIQYISGAVCYKCGKPVKETEEYCYDCKRKKHLFRQGVALFSYEYIRSSLYRYKYGERREYAAVYGKYMAARFYKEKIRWKPDALIPVPLHKKRRKQRGYNQAELIAKELGKWWEVPVITELVIRVKNTRPMKEIDGTERQNNLKKAFKLGKNDVKLNTIIIIDDIYTTGSTMDAVASVCKESGIANIYFMTVSIGFGL